MQMCKLGFYSKVQAFRHYWLLCGVKGVTSLDMGLHISFWGIRPSAITLSTAFTDAFAFNSKSAKSSLPIDKACRSGVLCSEFSYSGRA